MSRPSRPDPLARRHNLESFDCGVEELNVWLAQHARTAEGSGSARTFVSADEFGSVLGYYALAAASIEHDEATDRARRAMPRYPIPAVLLARLAVARSVQGMGVGAALLRDAALRTLAASEDLGVRVLLVHARDDRARSFYARHGFDPSPTDDLHLMIAMKDLRRAVRRA